MKEKNKSLFINSLISVSMCIMQFSVMADSSMEQGNKLETTVKVINAEQNVPFPVTDNTKALSPTNTDELYRVQKNNENFVFYVNNKPVNTDDTDKKVEYNSAVGYKLTSSDSVTDTGFVVGHKEVEDAGPTNQKERFFRYWNPSASSKSAREPLNDYSVDAQFSPSFPKL